MIYTAGDVMNDSAVLLNDAEQNLYSYTTQLPFLRMIMRDIELKLNLAGFQINLVSEEEIVVLANAVVLALPSNFFMPISLSERKNGTADTYIPMKEKPDVNGLQIQQTSALIYWDYRHNSINFLGATEDRQVRLFYYKMLTEFVDEDSIAEINGARNMLAYFTASFCALFIGQNKERASDLMNLGSDAYDTFESLVVKNNQGKRVRRHPFRSRSLFRSTLLGRLP